MMRVVGDSCDRRWSIGHVLAAALVLQQPLSPAVITVGGGCTLADAIVSANTDASVGGCSTGAGADVVELTEDVHLASPLPVIVDELFLEGSGFTIGRQSSAGAFRILELQVDGDVVLRNVALANGSVDGDGGGILNNASRLTLTGSRIVDNDANGFGGGIFSGDDARLLVVKGSTVSDNAANEWGGGLYGGDINVISDSTISGNAAYGAFGGGGISVANDSRVTVFNSTVSGNTAVHGAGGLDDPFGGTTILISSTIAGNTSMAGTGGLSNPYGWLHPTAEFLDTVIVGNGDLDCDGVLRNLGGSFDSDGSCNGAASGVPEVDLDMDLSNNGGPTLTHALLQGSAMISAAGACGPATDQRGFSRDSTCDSGAFEFGAAPVGGSLLEMSGRTVVCRNLDSGQAVTIPLVGAGAWNCQAEGLAVLPGDTVQQIVLGSSRGGAAGSVIGLSARRVECRNLTTADSLDIDLSSGPAWDCVAAGLPAADGDRIRMSALGDVP